MMEPNHRRDRKNDLIISAKLEEPPLRKGVIFRSRLIDKLNEGSQRRMTLVSAPAGFGKTSLILSWVKNGTQPIAWISLDPQDNNPARFFTYLATAISRTKPGISDYFIEKLHSQDMNTAMDMAQAILPELISWSPYTHIILDDYHYITDPAIHEAIGYLIQNLPNQPDPDILPCSGCHFVFITRNDPPIPLARWRSNQEICEIRTADLRFTFEEATQIYKQFHQMQLADEDIRQLVLKTEGWAASMQLVALSLSASKPREYPQQIDSLTGNNSFISDYLTEEVFSRLDPDTKSFLKQTSVLERFTGKLCDQVTGMSNSKDRLEKLEKNNLFVIPMDDRRDWYRYHQLFGDFLGNKLENDPQYSLEEIHTRAALWFEQNGYVEDSLKHWLKINRFDKAARVVADSSPGILSWGQFYLLRNIIEAFPDEAFQTYPWLSIYRAWAYYIMDPDLVETWLTLADQVLEKESTQQIHTLAEIHSMQGDIAAIRTLCASRRGDIPEIQKNAPRALDLLSPETKRVRGLVLSATAVGQYLDFHLDDAIHSLQVAKDTLLQGGNYGGAAEAFMKIGEIQTIQGKLNSAYGTYSSAIDLEKLHPADGQFIACISWSGKGEILYEWNRVDEALEALVTGSAGSKKMGLSERIVCDLALAKAWMNLGNLAQAEVIIGEYYHQLGKAQSLSRFEDRILDHWLVYLALQGRNREVRQLIRQYHIGDPLPANPDQEKSMISAAKALYHIGEFEQCLKLASVSVKPMIEEGRIGFAIKMLGLMSVSYPQVDKNQEGQESVLRMIQLSAGEGYFRSFLDLADPMKKVLNQLLHSNLIESNSAEQAYLIEIIGNFNLKASATSPRKQLFGDLSEVDHELTFALTEHEKKVLRLLIAGRNNKEIGCELSISVNTVKTHVMNIFNKLQVHNRFQAAVRVSQLKLKI